MVRYTSKRPVCKESMGSMAGREIEMGLSIDVLDGRTSLRGREENQKHDQDQKEVLIQENGNSPML